MEISCNGYLSHGLTPCKELSYLPSIEQHFFVFSEDFRNHFPNLLFFFCFMLIGGPEEFSALFIELSDYFPLSFILRIEI